MDGQQFDLISKWLATRESRRATLRGLAAGALALGLGRLSLNAALADCKKLGQKCAKDGDCCAGAQCKRNKCVCTGGNASCGDHLCCPPDRVCVGKAANPLDPPSDPDDLMKCICPTGFEEDADGTCVCKHTCGEFCCQPEDGEVCCASRGAENSAPCSTRAPTTAGNAAMCVRRTESAKGESASAHIPRSSAMENASISPMTTTIADAAATSVHRTASVWAGSASSNARGRSCRKVAAARTSTAGR